MFVQAECCGECRFYMASTKVCRRFPPVVMIIGVKPTITNPNGEPLFAGQFPQMAPTGWCGEFEVNPMGKPDA